MTSIYATCQHVEFREDRGRKAFPCQHEESGGKVCEREEAHDDDNHWWSRHTIMHERYGNGWACWQFKEPVAPISVKLYRDSLERKVAALEQEIIELETHLIDRPKEVR